MFDLVAQRVLSLFCVPEGPRSSLGEFTFFFFFLFSFSFFFSLTNLVLGSRASPRYLSFNGPIPPKRTQHRHPRWRPSIGSRVRSLFRTLFFLSFSCFFPPTNLVLGERSALRYFLFSFNDEFPSKRAQPDLPRWRARLAANTAKTPVQRF